MLDTGVNITTVIKKIEMKLFNTKEKVMKMDLCFLKNCALFKIEVYLKQLKVNHLHKIWKGLCRSICFTN